MAGAAPYGASLPFPAQTDAHHAPRRPSDTHRPVLPRMMWSSNATPTSSPASAIRRVNDRSSPLGDGSPEGCV